MQKAVTTMNRTSQVVALQLLRGYKALVSPLLPAACRYVPTCSEYAMEAVERYGALRGGLRAFWRLLRCNPLVNGGYDPVVKPHHHAIPAVTLEPTVFRPTEQ
jgi:uncharacterized protein